MTASLAAAATVFIAILAVGLTLDQTKVPPATIDKAAKPFRAAWIQGRELLPSSEDSHFSLSDYHGKPIVLNFWASWCVSCRTEAHELEVFWQKHRSEVMVVGIAIQDERDTAQKFAEYYGKSYILGLDEDGNAAIDYGVSGVPETFLIDRQGVIRHKEVGPVNAAMLEKLLAKIL